MLVTFSKTTSVLFHLVLKQLISFIKIANTLAVYGTSCKILKGMVKIYENWSLLLITKLYFTSNADSPLKFQEENPFKDH